GRWISLRNKGRKRLSRWSLRLCPGLAAQRRDVFHRNRGVDGKSQSACGNVQAGAFQVARWVESRNCQAGWRVERYHIKAAISGKRSNEGLRVRRPSRQPQSWDMDQCLVGKMWRPFAELRHPRAT